MTQDETLTLAHREAWRYKKSSDPHHSDTYTFNRSTLLEFARKLVEAEREACARLCEDNCAGYSYGRESQGPCLTEFPKEGGGRHDGMTYAAAIRMRSNA